MINIKKMDEKDFVFVSKSLSEKEEKEFSEFLNSRKSKLSKVKERREKLIATKKNL